MTRVRQFGDGTPFGEWVRGQQELDSQVHGLALTDADMIFHRYRARVDNLPDRAVQFMMMVEVKTRGVTDLSFAQRDTLFATHQLMVDKKQIRNTCPGNGQRSIWHFGCYVLSLSGTSPLDSDRIQWGVFTESGRLAFVDIAGERELIELLRFDRDPEDPRQKFTHRRWRRHHSVKRLEVETETALGFTTTEIVTRRS